MPFTAATALLHGEVTLESFTAQRLSDPAVLGLARLIQCDIDPGQPNNTASVSVETTAGTVHREFVSQVPGDPGQPLDPGVLERKFRDCAARAAVPLSAGQASGLVKVIGDLEHVTDVSKELSPLLAGA